MAFRPDPAQPSFQDLITSLNVSGRQIKDNPLYQTIYVLLQRITTSRDNIQKQIKDVEELTNNLLASSYLTVNDESAILVNSRREIAGTNITFDDTVPNQRTINAAGTDLAVVAARVIHGI